MAEAGVLKRLREVLKELDEEEEVPNVTRVFQKMIDPPYKGKVLFGHVTKMAPEDFKTHNHTALIRWFRNHEDKFAVFEGDDGRVAMFAVRIRNARLCWRSNQQPSECKEAECIRFHVCKKYLGGGGDCTAAACPMDHHFQSDHSRRLLKKYGLETFNDEDLLTIFRQSHLQICNFYDRKGTCDNEDRCTKLHLCADYVLGVCTEPCPKKRKHDLDTVHSLRLLRVYDLGGALKQDVLKQLLIVNFFGQRRQDAMNMKDDEKLRTLAEALFGFRQHDDAGLADFGLKPLKRLGSETGKTKKTETKSPAKSPAKDGAVEENSDKMAAQTSRQDAARGSATDQHRDDAASPRHVTKRITKRSPGRTVWQMELFGQWRPLDEIRCKRLEESFCDPANELITITLPDVEECFLFDTLIRVNFSTMTAMLVEGQEDLKLRRIENPDDDWMWYFEEDNGTWVPYPGDDQILLNAAVSVRQKRVFVGKKELYRVKLSDMTQKNRETGKERKIRRRPILA